MITRETYHHKNRKNKWETAGLVTIVVIIGAFALINGMKAQQNYGLTKISYPQLESQISNHKVTNIHFQNHQAIIDYKNPKKHNRSKVNMTNRELKNLQRKDYIKQVK